MDTRFRLILGAIGYVALISIAAGVEAASSTVELFDWQHLPALPHVQAGAMVGASGDRITAILGREVFIFEAGKRQWTVSGRLDRPIGFGGLVGIDKRWILIGGQSRRRCLADTMWLEIGTEGQRVRMKPLPPLPAPRAHFGAARLGHVIYVAGGCKSTETHPVGHADLWALDLTETNGNRDWQVLQPCPGPGRIDPVVVARDGGLYVIGGVSGHRVLTDAYRYDPREKAPSRWQRVADPPRAVAAAPGCAFGGSSILVFGGLTQRAAKQQLSREILAYNTITDTWTCRGQTPNALRAAVAIPWQGTIVVMGGQDQRERPSAEVRQARPRSSSSGFQAVDYAVLVMYLAVLVAVGWHFSKREKSVEDYLLGGRRVPWWAAGLSILATQVSSIGFMAVPAKSYATDWVYFLGVATWFMAVPIVTHFYIPFFRGLNVTTAYEYLEHRFNLLVRWYGSCAFIILQFGRMAIVLYLPAIALSVVTGVDVYLSILVMGVLATLYTVLGGIEAVVWTDVLQAIVLAGGAAIAAIVAVFGVEGGIGEFLNLAQADHKFQVADWNWNIAAAGVWVVVVGNVFQRLADLTADQTVVQRYLTTRDERQANRALWANVAASIPWAILVFFLGTALYVFFKTRPELLDPALPTDAIVPWFVVRQMPPGISGLVIAALFAAAMSSLDSSIHSVATTLVSDFYRRLRPDTSDHHRLKLARWLTALLGAAGTAGALIIATFPVQSLWDLFLSIAGLTIGGVAGLFVLGIFTRRANGPGALVGALVSGAVLYLVQSRTNVHFFLYAGIGIGTCTAVGYLVSRLLSVCTHAPWSSPKKMNLVASLQDSAAPIQGSRNGERPSSSGPSNSD